MGVVPVKLPQLESLHEAFARVPDPRAGNRQHRLAVVLAIVASSNLMGRRRPADFLRLAQQLNPRQREALGYYRAPGKRVRVASARDVFYTLLGRVDLQAFAEVLNAWLRAQHGQLPAVVVRSTVTDKKTRGQSGETRLFVPSLPPAALTRRQWLARCRGHRRVESANHHRRDVT